MRVHILHHASEAPAFGLEMIEELRRHGYSKGGGERPLTANFHNGLRCRLMARSRPVKSNGDLTLTAGSSPSYHK